MIWTRLVRLLWRLMPHQCPSRKGSVAWLTWHRGHNQRQVADVTCGRCGRVTKEVLIGSFTVRCFGDFSEVEVDA